MEELRKEFKKLLIVVADLVCRAGLIGGRLRLFDAPVLH